MSRCPVDFKQCQCSATRADPCPAVEAMRKDAERYRFLRDNPWPSPVQSVVVRHANAVWDATIDAAMQAHEAVGAA